VAAWLAVIVDVPAPTTVTVVPFTVATAVLLLEKVMAPALFEVGAVKVKGASPKVFAGTVKAPNVGAGSELPPPHAFPTV
jgi:hypothetical protein